jgi:hypothetical protein
MKIVFILFMLLPSHFVISQWQSIPKLQTYKRTPYGEFTINPYTNDLWLNAEEQVAVFENNGDLQVFDQQSGEISNLSSFNGLQFEFTPSHTYFAHPLYGLYTFDNYIESMKYSFSSFGNRFRNISTNEDSVYIGFSPPGLDLNYTFKIYTESSFQSTNHFSLKIVSKSNYRYGIHSMGFNIVEYTGNNNGDHFYITETDPDYLYAQYSDIKFTRLTDTLYVGGSLGISKAYNYDFFDTITPYNTTNMPSSNVLEMEFDENDTLWAVFGDGNNVPFALAMLDGTNWTNIYTSSNSPIDFDNFYGLEIDTLGNVWVVDDDALHVLSAPTNPSWLKTFTHTPIQSFSMHPNPSNGSVWFETETEVDEIVLLDLMGRKLETRSFEKKIHFHQPGGGYFIQLYSKGILLGTRKLILE